MCGIFAFYSNKKVSIKSTLLKALLLLEYRGYDSSGIAYTLNNHLYVYKAKGPIIHLKQMLQDKTITTTSAIGHTRWATHGKVTKYNAHPHTDCKNTIALVHNGIIENYLDLKQNLKKHKFVSQTDSEIIAHLLEEKINKSTSNKLDAFISVFSSFQGLNACVVLFKDNTIICARKGSPLVVGKNTDTWFICSDIPTLSHFSNYMYILNKNQGFAIMNNKPIFFDSKTKKIVKLKPQKIQASINTMILKKSHYMINEIQSQPELLKKISVTNYQTLHKITKSIKNSFGTYFTACGSAAHAGLAATYIFAHVAHRHVNFALASEFPYFESFLTPRSLLITASQSGETMDTLQAVRSAKRKKSKIISLINTRQSTLERLSDYVLYLNAGHEQAVVSTKAYIAKLALFYRIAYSLIKQDTHIQSLLTDVAEKTKQYFKTNYINNIKRIAKHLSSQNTVFLIGRGVNYATALEGALKLKEASYVHAEGFAGGELKHGVIALIAKNTPCIVLISHDETYNATMSNMIELKSRGAYIIGVSPKRLDYFDCHIPVVDIYQLSAITHCIPLQLLSYYIALQKGINPDRPRNLAKSVTVS